MKQLQKIALSLVFALTLNACSRFEDATFDQSSAQRMNEAFVAYNEILQNAAHGWSIDYYYGDFNNPEGGYKMLAKFKDGKVDLASELTANKVNAGTTVSSTYSFTSENGPILSFDSYNPILHYYSEATGSNPSGLGGDFEFIMVSVTPQKIILRGKKFANQIIMRPLAEEKDFPTYVNEVKALKATLSKMMRFDVLANGSTNGVAVNLDQSKWYNTDKPEEVTYYAVSDKGIDLQSPVSIEGKEYDEFVFNPEDRRFTAKDDVKIALQAVQLEYNDIPGDYVFSYVSNVGSKNEVVKITEKVAGKTFTLTSKSFIQPIQLEYSNGNLLFKPQNLGKVPNGSSGNLWMTVGYDSNLLGYVIPTFETSTTFVMGGLWMQGTREKPILNIMSQYTRQGILGSFPMKYLALHKVVGTNKEFYDNEQGVHFMINMKLTKQ